MTRFSLHLRCIHSDSSKASLRTTMSDNPLTDHNHGATTVQEGRPQLKKPPLYKVLMLNDDYTPMEFVVQVLQIFFAMNGDKATEVMLQVHTRGVGICGIYTRDIAETKAAQVNQYATDNQMRARSCMSS
ncbi:MAG: hypothetical protein FD130_595 [Halothiobacillaceae bacterium]|nr:MAG: hypothetical protein FD130_595 [Halothiobacillaceae bacterium]